MAREDPGSLEAVSNFKIGHKKHGYVVWLEPVNVWGLEIEDLVAFLPGSIDVRRHTDPQTGACLIDCDRSFIKSCIILKGALQEFFVNRWCICFSPM